MKTSYFIRNSVLFLFSFIFCFVNINAQEDSSKIINCYEAYASDAREIVYIHLNKSTYIKGESIGFTAYVLDKKNKKPSQLTTNLYVSIEDQDKNVLNQKLLKVENGVASNIINLDSTYTTGYYTFKAYTNWMRNFNEQNYFVESIRVIDPEVEEYINTASIKNEIDAQFLPEGGHILNGVVNNIGVVLKDKRGYGVASNNGSVYDQYDNLITEFEVNKFGIGKFPLLADLSKNYTVKFTHLNKDYSFNLDQRIEPIGVTLSLVNHRNKAMVALMTNKESLERIKDKSYQLAVHNGDKIETTEVLFNEDLNIIKVFNLDELPSGMNVFTLFNEKNKPVIERLFFNYNGIDILSSNDLVATKANDSITVKLNYKHIGNSQFNNLSVSVLPQETESYNRHHNMLSYTFLQPYVKGNIEHAKYYFTDITEEKQAELDNLLITQGWSSYDWTEIFRPSTLPMYAFEQGINLRANINGASGPESTYMVHALNNHEPKYIDVNENENVFTIENVFLTDKEKIHLSRINKRDQLEPARLYLQAFPSTIPALDLTNDVLNPKAPYGMFASLKDIGISFDNINKVQQLEEVVVSTDVDRKTIRTRKLGLNSLGRVNVIDDNDRIQFQTLANFLNFNGWRAGDVNGRLMVTAMGLTNAGGPPTIFLDDMLVLDTSLLYLFPLNNVSWIESGRLNVGNTINGGSGYIKIYTDYTNRGSRANAISTQDYSLPLTFSTKKKYYTPKYRYYNDDFYKGYGTIDWKPELTTDAFGNISIKIMQPEVPITLFIEGIANDGSFIFEEKSISLN